MDAVLAPLALRRRFRKRLWGYSTREVDEYVDDVIATNSRIRDEIERLRSESDPVNALGRDIAAVLRTLADSVSEVRERAEAEAAQLRADAEAEAAASLEEVATRFATVQQQRTAASESVARALDALQQAMIALAGMPTFTPPGSTDELVNASVSASANTSVGAPVNANRDG